LHCLAAACLPPVTAASGGVQYLLFLVLLSLIAVAH